MGSLPSNTSHSLSTYLDKAHVQYNQKHPQSRENHVEACRYMPGGNTRTVLHTTPFPLTIDLGRDCHLTTVDGIRYVDFLGEYTAGIYGHSHPVIKDAVQMALESGWNYGGHNPLEPQLARRVCERFPAVELVRFVNSGTEANMMAIATAVAYTGKKKVLLFNKGYHGSTISGNTSAINLPHEFVVGTYNDVEGTEDLVRSLLPSAKDTLAAILVEPMLGSGGCYAGTPRFLGSLRKLAEDANALLIFDEVMTSRLHYRGLGSQTGVTPDLMTLGKWVGGGMSFGAFGGRRDIMALYDPRSGSLQHPGTFNNNVFTMAAGIAGCDLLTADKLGALNHLGDSMRQQIERVLSTRAIQGTLPAGPVTDDMQSPQHPRCPPKMFVSGVGSLMAIHFAGPDRDLLQGLFFHHMLESGVYLAPRGFIALNIVLTEEHIAQFVQAVEGFCDKYDRFLIW
ncbi:hypothetical protein A1O3_03830 [Capronia epimyces CBS 606.96]|uniref:Glutamate-1-semialdehyde 2,1-aminomutase n=1 Tax=Capronia epimyces CBS 606.96 TaxID=1182542 RepID=W9YCC8_9EURO|nr:uncharacterized protein A1O3_03830 [Capronia epimyces CBS 606.96]EXJ86876.1 hypothetical protein A1O3_03830 [Capronia epimyces CBS 606.96]